MLQPTNQIFLFQRNLIFKCLQDGLNYNQYTQIAESKEQAFCGKLSYQFASTEDWFIEKLKDSESHA